MRIKKCRVKFTPYQTNEGLQMLGRTKAVLRAAGGATVSTIVYLVKGSGHSLLGLQDGENLGIIEINPEGKTDQQMVRQLATYKKEQVLKRGVISVDPNSKPVQQKQRMVALRFIPRLKKHLEERRELKAAGMVSGPNKSEDATR